MKFLFHVFLFCFVLLESSDDEGETPNAFIFSLNNYEGLAPFVSKVIKDKAAQAIYRGSNDGPVFGDDLVIYLNAADVDYSKAVLGAYYSVPASVNDKAKVLKGPNVNFSPDEVEVFYLVPSMQDNTD